MLDIVYGKAFQVGDTITLDADEAAARKANPENPIGCALAFLRWNGKPVTLKVELLRAWRTEPWADLWLMSRPTPDKILVPPVYPLRYARFRKNALEMGVVPNKRPDSQQIVGTDSFDWNIPDGRMDRYNIGQQVGNSIPIWWQGRTICLVSPRTGELGVYVEGCVATVTYERAEG